MKKYIVPQARFISLNLDGDIMLFNGSMVEGYGDEGAEKYSNRRSASNVIWGFDDEAGNK